MFSFFRQVDTQGVDTALLTKRLESRKKTMKTALNVCARCTLCADSCFLFHVNDYQPEYMPSYKFLHSVGMLYKYKGKVSKGELEAMRELVWNKCALCTRCYCPLGINLPDAFAFARSVLREQGVFPDYEVKHSTPG